MVLAFVLAFAAAAQQQEDPGELRLDAARLVAAGRYAEAEPVLSHLIELRGETADIEALGSVYRSEGRNADAEKMYQRAIAAITAPNSYDLIPPLKALAGIYASMGPSRNTDAERAYLRIITVREKNRGMDDLDLAADCAALATFYLDRKRYAVAEPNLRRAIVIIEKRLGPGDPSLVPVLDSIAALYVNTKNYAAAESPLRHAISIQESVYGPNHYNVATYLDSLAMVFYLSKRYAEAEPLYKRSLPIWEAKLGADAPQLATTLDNLAVVYASQEKFALAEPLYQRSLALREKDSVLSMNNLALALDGKGDNAGAEVLYKRAITLAEKIPSLAGPANVGEVELLQRTLQNYATLLHKMGREAEARKVEQRLSGRRSNL